MPPKYWTNTRKPTATTNPANTGTDTMNDSSDQPASAARAIIILGAPRSGTSLLTRGLQTLGVDLGHDLSVNPQADNPKGCWQDQAIATLNQQLLQALGMRWHSVRPLPTALLLSPSLQPLRQQAATRLQQHFGDSTLWGFKHPSTSRLLPFWLAVLDDIGVPASFVLSLREPAAVAHSLLLRDQFSAEKSALLWLVHTLPVLPAAAGRHPTAVVEFEQLLSTPAAQLRGLAEHLEIALHTQQKAAIEEYANNFVDASLSHNHATGWDTDTAIGAQQLAARSHALLRQVSHGELTATEVTGRIADIVGELAAFAPVSAHLDALEDAMLTLLSRNETALQQQIDQRDIRIADLTQQLEAAGEDRLSVDKELERERYTVLKPMMRNTYQRMVTTALAMPPPVTKIARRVKRTILPGTIPLRPRNEAVVPVLTSSGGQSVETDPWVLKIRSAATGSGAEGHDVIIFPVIDWHFRVQRPQHLARHLAAAGHRIIYLSTTFADGPAGSFRIIESPATRVFICQLGMPTPHPVIYDDLLRGKQQQALAKSLKALADRCGLGQITALLDLPFWRPVAEALPGSTVVYDCMDYHAGFSTNSQAVLDEEDRLIREADCVITTAARLSDKVAEIAPNTIIRNAGEIEFFRYRPEKLAYKTTRPVVGYFGAISEWFDIELLCAAARHFSQWDFVLVGNVVNCDISCAKALPNVKFIGEVPYADLPGWLHAFDVCAIPFRITELTLCTNPVKVYEYLAAGKPVVATDLPEVRLMEEYVHLSESEQQFIAALDAAMQEKDDREMAGRRTRWALTQDWTARAGQLDRAIEGLFPRVSVIVLTYNNLDFTKACLSSIERFTHYPDWELVIVDNASKDDSPAFLQEYAAEHPGVKLILNPENRGFSGGNNDGLAAADGDVLIILNNDTQVTPGWMTGLTGHLRRNPDIGLLGPVTNNIGNEAKLEIEYNDSEEMLEKAYAYTSSHPRELLYVNTVAFFCVAMPRKVYEAVGPMDEDFGRGFFEDDDYSNRVREQGYKVAIADDVFVHHHLSASFSKLAASEKQKLFENGKKVYEAKWGPWVPHKYRD